MKKSIGEFLKGRFHISEVRPKELEGNEGETHQVYEVYIENMDHPDCLGIVIEIPEEVIEQYDLEIAKDILV